MADSNREHLTGFTRDMTITRMVMYAGASWDWHRLHYDEDYARESGLPGPIVDGQMFGALLAEQVLDHFGPAVRIEAMDFRFRSTVQAGETVTVTGTIASQEQAQEGHRITCEQIVTAGDRICVTGTTRVLLPSDRAEG